MKPTHTRPTRLLLAVLLGVPLAMPTLLVPAPAAGQTPAAPRPPEAGPA